MQTVIHSHQLMEALYVSLARVFDTVFLVLSQGVLVAIALSPRDRVLIAIASHSQHDTRFHPFHLDSMSEIIINVLVPRRCQCLPSPSSILNNAVGL